MTADDVIEAISKTLAESDGKFIEHIANQVLSRPVKYVGDSVFEESSEECGGKTGDCRLGGCAQCDYEAHKHEAG